MKSKIERLKWQPDYQLRQHNNFFLLKNRRIVTFYFKTVNESANELNKNRYKNGALSELFYYSDQK